MGRSFSKVEQATPPGTHKEQKPLRNYI